MSSATIGVSACLIGRPVRYDGGHRADSFVAGDLARRVRLVAVCPEVELGLGTPRPTLQLVRNADDLRLVESGGRDLTTAMREFAAARVEALATEDLDGYVLKSRSPSCAIADADRLDEHGTRADAGPGLFTDALTARWPDLPLIDERGLAEALLRRDFLARVAAFRDVKRLFRHAWSRGDVVAFHTRHKLTLSAHTDAAYRALGRFVANLSNVARRDVPARYTTALMTALASPTTIERHVNVLTHAIGHFRGRADEATRRTLTADVEAFRTRGITLDDAIAAFAARAHDHGVVYLSGQSYFALDPLA